MLTRPGQTLTWDAENRLRPGGERHGHHDTTYDGDGERVLLAKPAGVTLFVSPGYEVFVPATSQTSTITATVYATQTYKVYFPLVMGCDYQLAGRQVRATKNIFANGQRVAMQVGCSGTPTYLYQDHLGGTAAADGGQARGTARTGLRGPARCPRTTSSRVSGLTPGPGCTIMEPGTTTPRWGGSSARIPSCRVSGTRRI